MNELVITLSVEDGETSLLSVDSADDAVLSVDGTFIDGGRYYDGEYEVTPTRSTQVLETGGFKMAQNVIVNPIPRNYGLITYDGSGLMVS